MSETDSMQIARVPCGLSGRLIIFRDRHPRFTCTPHTIVGNAKVFADNIQNYSVNPYRRVDLTVTISNAVDHRDAIRLLKQRIAAIPNVRTSPPPDVDVLQFTPAGPQLCVRPYCANEHYWQVYFDTNRITREAFGDAGFPVPMPAYAVRHVVCAARQHGALTAARRLTGCRSRRRCDSPRRCAGG